MNIFKEAIMTCRRILEHKAMMATPEYKDLEKAKMAFEFV